MVAIAVVGKIMKMTELRKKAKQLGVKPAKMKKADLIHAIQTAEGFVPCFGTSDGSCDQFDCCFRTDCIG